MYVLTLIAFSIIISLVPFSVALSSSVYRCIEWKEAMRIALVFTVFQSVMAAIGWGIGYAVKGWLHNMAVPVAVFTMFFIGLRYFADSRRKGREMRTMAVENMRILLGFAFVTSINTLLLGISMGILYTDLMNFIGILFSVVFLMTVVGIRAGKMGWMNLGKAVEMAGGLLLFGISIFILVQYLKLV